MSCLSACQSTWTFSPFLFSFYKNWRFCFISPRPCWWRDYYVRQWRSALRVSKRCHTWENDKSSSHNRDENQYKHAKLCCRWGIIEIKIFDDWHIWSQETWDFKVELTGQNPCESSYDKIILWNFSIPVSITFLWPTKEVDLIWYSKTNLGQSLHPSKIRGEPPRKEGGKVWWKETLLCIAAVSKLIDDTQDKN